MGGKYAEDYERLKIIGRGAFGHAVLCTHRRTHERVVVKVLHPKPTARHKALNEIQILRHLKHPNIIEFFDSWSEGEKLYISMEYAEGGDLRAVVLSRRRENAPFTERQITGWMLQLCCALHYLHGMHVLHRDLKSQNIFLRDSGRVIKVGDFGISKQLDNAGDFTNTVIGTPYYISPEIAAGKRYNAKSDVWAVGVLLYELMTFEYPFIASSQQDLFRLIKLGVRRPLPKGVGYSCELVSFMDSLLQVDPAKRPSITRILAMRVLRGDVRDPSSDHPSTRRPAAPQDNLPVPTLRKGVGSVRSGPRVPSVSPARRTAFEDGRQVRREGAAPRVRTGDRRKAAPLPSTVHRSAVKVTRAHEARPEDLTVWRMHPSRGFVAPLPCTAPTRTTGRQPRTPSIPPAMPPSSVISPPRSSNPPSSIPSAPLSAFRTVSKNARPPPAPPVRHPECLTLDLAKASMSLTSEPDDARAIAQPPPRGHLDPVAPSLSPVFDTRVFGTEHPVQTQRVVEALADTLQEVDAHGDYQDDNSDFEDAIPGLADILHEACGGASAWGLEKFTTMGGHTFADNLEGITVLDTLTTQAEGLGKVLEDILGESVFMGAFKLLTDNTRAFPVKEVKKLLGPSKVAYVHLLIQLAGFLTSLNVAQTRVR